MLSRGDWRSSIDKTLKGHIYLQENHVYLYVHGEERFREIENRYMNCVEGSRDGDISLIFKSEDKGTYSYVCSCLDDDDFPVYPSDNGTFVLIETEINTLDDLTSLIDYQGCTEIQETDLGTELSFWIHNLEIDELGIGQCGYWCYYKVFEHKDKKYRIRYDLPYEECTLLATTQNVWIRIGRSESFAH